MEIYLVGGAVRDQLLGVPVKDRDWVVVCATPEMLLEKGFRPVGQDFPVFLHPETNEEYALARTERKSGHGYGGFTFYTAPDVTLEDDLCRRDLTINAIAQSDSGEIVDPYNGQQDLANRTLRHVSSAFEEDPLRVLRVARFAARFAHLGFTVADETLNLMQRMTISGELDWLVAERVWQETERALGEKTPSTYFQLLLDIGALDILMPEVATAIRQQPDLLEKLDIAAQAETSTAIRFALLCRPGSSNADGKQHKKYITGLCRRLKTPQSFLQLSELVATFWSQWLELDNTQNQKADAYFALIEKTDAIRRPERFHDLLQTFSFLSVHKTSDKHQEALTAALKKVQQINATAFVEQGFKGKELGLKIRSARLTAVVNMLPNRFP